MSNNDTRAWKDQYMLRLPDGLRDRIKAAAATIPGQSMNGMIVAVLEREFPEPRWDAETLLMRIERIALEENEEIRAEEIQALNQMLEANELPWRVVEGDGGISLTVPNRAQVIADRDAEQRKYLQRLVTAPVQDEDPKPDLA